MKRKSTQKNSKELVDTATATKYKRDVQALILANLTKEEIGKTLGISRNAVTAALNSVLASMGQQGIDITKATNASTRKLLLFSSVHDVLSGLLLSELFKCKRAIQGAQAPTTASEETEEPGLRSKRSTGSRAVKPATEAMLYNRLALLSDQIRKNNKAYFDTIGPMGVADPRTHIQTKGPSSPSTNNISGEMSDSDAFAELERSARRQLAYVERKRKELDGDVQLDADIEVIDE